MSDIDFDPVKLYNAVNHVKNIEEKFDNLYRNLKRVDISGVSLSTASNLNLTESIISNISSGEIPELKKRVYDIKTVFEKSDPEIAILFDYLESKEHDTDIYGEQYLFDVDELVNLYNDGNLKPLAMEDLFELYNVVGDDGNIIEDSGKMIVLEKMNIIGSDEGLGQNREVTVNKALMLLKLFSDKGYKPKCIDDGYPPNLEEFNDVFIYSPNYPQFISLLIDGNIDLSYREDAIFYNEFLQYGSDISDTTSFEYGINMFDTPDTLKYGYGGDLLVNVGDVNKIGDYTDGYVGLIISNDPYNNSMVVMEEDKTNSTITLSRRTYDDILENNIHLRHLDTEYTGIE